MTPEPPTFNFWTVSLAAAVGAVGGVGWWYVMAAFEPSPMVIPRLGAALIGATNLVFVAIIMEVFFR